MKLSFTKNLFIKISLIMFTILGIIMIITSSLHAAKTGTIYDDARSSTSTMNGTVSVVFGVIGLVASIAGLVLTFYKKLTFLPLILILTAFASFTIAFAMPLNDQKLTRDNINSYESLIHYKDLLTSSNDTNAGLASEFASKGILTPEVLGDVAYKGAIGVGATPDDAVGAKTSIITAAKSINLSNFKEIVSLMTAETTFTTTIKGFNSYFLEEAQTMLDNELVQVKADLFTINIAAFSVISLIVLLSTSAYTFTK